VKFWAADVLLALYEKTLVPFEPPELIATTTSSSVPTGTPGPDMAPELLDSGMYQQPCGEVFWRLLPLVLEPCPSIVMAALAVPAKSGDTSSKTINANVLITQFS
jgi:hypothetical protein